jgi:hypothetical protein
MKHHIHDFKVTTRGSRLAECSICNKIKGATWCAGYNMAVIAFARIKLKMTTSCVHKFNGNVCKNCLIHAERVYVEGYEQGAKDFVKLII